jgi:ferric-dicitrate binding protein FerR (iron transport regulator)
MEQKTRQLETWYAQQASSWVETMRRPKPGDEVRFVAWLKESPRNVRDFLLMISVDQALEELDPARLRDVESLVASVSGRVAALPAPRAVPGRLLSRWKPAALAAGVLAASLGGWAFFGGQRASFQEFETATGEQRTFELEDGSVVYLNTHSRVAIRFAAGEREVRLSRGEALFRVHHDAGRPFRVYTDDAMVQAVGTQFDVYRRDDGTVVSVLEGRVDVTPAAAGSASESSGGSPSESCRIREHSRGKQRERHRGLARAPAHLQGPAARPDRERIQPLPRESHPAGRRRREGADLYRGVRCGRRGLARASARAGSGARRRSQRRGHRGANALSL